MAKFKKVLAGVLAAAMVVTAAPFANLGTVQAATKATKGTSTLKLSATKATIKVGNKKTIKVTVNKKQTAALKVTLKSSNAKVAKVASKATIKKGAKTASFKITGKKAGSAKITVSYKTSANKTVKETIKVTVKANTVALTGVSLNNNTPKVGDELSAVLAPAGATNVASYQWFTGATASLTDAISGATAATYKVTDAELGKFIGVVVTDAAGQSFTAVSSVAVQAADITALEITEAKQTGAKTADITFNKAPGTVTVVVKKDNKTVSQEVLATKENVITLQFGSNLVKGTYSVTVTDADKKECTKDFEAEDAVLTTVEFANKNLMVTSNTTDGMKKAYAVLTSTDQWGNHMNISGATFTVSKESSHSFNADSGVLTVNAPTASGTTTYQNANYTIGETVVVTVQYTAGQTPKVVTGVLTVSLADAVKTLTFGDLTTDNKTYAGKDTTQVALVNGDYYFPVTEAVSEAGIKLDTDMLNSMIQSTENPGGTLFISPNSSTKASAYVYANGFVEKKINGVATPCLSVKAGNNINQLNIDLDYTITVVSQSGLNQTLTVSIKRNAVVKTVEITNIPAMYAKKYVEIPLKAADIYGNAYDLYDKLTVGATYAAATSTSEVTSASVVVRIDDEKAGSSTDTNFTITSTGGVKAKVVVDTSKKTSTLMVEPQAKGYMTITGTTAGFGAINYANITVNGQRETTGIQGLKNVSTDLLVTAGAQDLLSKNVVFTGADSEAVASTDDNYPVYRDRLLQTGNQLINNSQDGAGTTVDESKQLLCDVNDKPVANGNATATDVESALLGGADAASLILPTVTTDEPVFTWSVSMTDGKMINTTGAAAYNGSTAVDEAAQAATIFGTSTTVQAYVGDAIVLDKESQKIYVNRSIAKTGSSDTVRVHLYKIVKNATAGYDVSEVTHKDYEFSVVSEADVDYKLSIDKEDNKEPKLYANKADADSIGVTLTTSTNAAVPQSKLAAGTIAFSIDGKNTDAFKYSGGKIYMTKALDASGKAKMVATFATETTKTATAEVEFEYTNEKPYATAGGLYSTTTYAPFDGSEVYADATGLVNSVSSSRSGGYQVIVYDQYGNNIVTDWPSDAKTDPVSVKVTSAASSGVTNAIYSASGITLYGGSTADDITVVLTSGSVTKTFYVDVPTATLAANPAATLASVTAKAGSVTVMTYGTANSTTGINLEGALSDGTAIPTNGLSLSKLQWTSPDGVTKTIAADLDGTVDGGEVVPTWTDGSDNFKTANTVKAGTYVATFVADGFDGEATYSFTVDQKTLAANDLVATLTTAGGASAKAKITLTDGTNDGAFAATDVKSMTVTDDGTAVAGALDTGDHLIWEASANGAQTTDITVVIAGQGNYKGSITYTTSTLSDSTVMTLA